jgi:DNA-binding transcriptional regulator YiaG
MKKQAGNKVSVGGRVIQRLEVFKDALKSGQRISDRFTCRKVVLDLEPVVHGPAQVKMTRELLNVSQALFGKFLGVSVNTIRAWEQGANVPSAMASRFMDEIRRDPKHWIERLKTALVCK